MATAREHLGVNETETIVAEATVENGFDNLGLDGRLAAAVRSTGYSTPTQVQAEAIPMALEGADLMVSSSTGSGKTAAFLLPALQRILVARGDNTKRREKGVVHGPRVLVLAPTRELALQVAKAATSYGRNIPGLRVATVVGGVPYGAQLKALRGPLDVLIATPGRLLDHLGTGAAMLGNLETLVLDEADRMLDMGFIDDIQAIAAVTPAERQTMMFSATFAGHVGRLAQQLTKDPKRIEVASHTDRHDNIEQRLYWVDHTGHKHDLLDHFLTERDVDQAVIFTSTQHDADRLADRLADLGHAVAALHGGMPQGRRNRVLTALRQRQLRVLVATDVAARGIDVPTITHVINYGMPMKAEDYVHRIGRTGRAGRNGLALTLAGRDDQHMIRRIERFTSQDIPVATVAGMEPTKPVPSARPVGGPGKFNKKPMPGQRHGQGGWNKGPRDEGRFESRGPRDEQRPPRHEGGFRPEGRPAFRQDERRSFDDRRPQGDRPQGDRPFGDRPFGQRPAGNGGFKPYGQPRHEGARGGFGQGQGGEGSAARGERRHEGGPRPERSFERREGHPGGNGRPAGPRKPFGARGPRG
ncbi:MAG: DEAD/DEAH box helicase [Aquabacterium sp.]|nr:MAG: DEAD/DEAH box helicase [Aquabacterium sp.]